jgi:hypothetical protein
VYGLSGFLSNAAEWNERTVRRNAGFFLEFAPCCGEQIFAGFDDAFWNRPRTSVAISPEWTSGMGDEELELSVRSTEE